MGFAICNAGVHVPTAKFEIVQTNFPGCGEFLQKFFAAYAGGLEVYATRGKASQTIGHRCINGQLRQDHAIQLRMQVIRGARKKLRKHGGANGAASPLRAAIDNIELQILQRTLKKQLLQFQFFDGEFVYLQVSGNI